MTFMTNLSEISGYAVNRWREIVLTNRDPRACMHGVFLGDILWLFYSCIEKLRKLLDVQ